MHSTVSDLQSHISELRPLTSNLCAKPRLAYMLAASHSGSTLLSMLLGAHPEAFTTGELKATNMGDPDQYRCSCKHRIKQCPFWGKVSERMAAKGFARFQITKAGTSIFEFENAYCQRLLAPLHRGPVLELIREFALSLSSSWRKHFREVQRRNQALIESLLEITDAKLILDSSKQALRLKYLLHNPALDIKVIRLIRDGRAVALTYMDDWTFADSADPALRGGGTGQKRRPPRRNMADAANEWKRSNEAADCLVTRLPRSQWMEVHYEEVCTQTVPTLRRLCQFLEIDPERINLNFRDRELHVIGNGMRMDTTSEITLDERWKQHLTPDDLHVFDQVAGDLNRRYGYR